MLSDLNTNQLLGLTRNNRNFEMTSQPGANNLDVVYGEYRDFTQVQEFVAGMIGAGCDGTLYIGYPVLSIDDGKIEYDALLVSPKKGVIVFDLYTAGGIAPHSVNGISEELIARQEQLYAALFNRLNSFKELRRGRALVVTISTVSISPLAGVITSEGDYHQAPTNLLDKFYESLTDSPLTTEQEQHLNAAIQRISNLKPQKKRDNISRADSRGAVIKEIEQQIANLDLWQKRGSIEYVNGPQRIKGLAGSGKTVVLALKAAYLHVKRPDWNIVITFNSRSLYQQFESLLTRFVYSQINDEPDWDKLHLMHSWGESGRPGVYSYLAQKAEVPYKDFSSAARLFGYSQAFSGACKEVLDAIKDEDLNLFDMVLIDEAQDLPTSFFQLVYKATKSPKRIVWAYDDLQNLGDYRMPSAKDLFGVDENGNPRVTLKNRDNHPQEDIVLPRCYRTPPWSLVVAHGLGFGLSRPSPIQIFPEPAIWQRLGYKVEEGDLAFDQDVTLVRDATSVPEFFERLLKPEQTLTFHGFSDRSAQYDWIAGEIKRLIDSEDLQCSDFLVVIPDTYKSKSIAAAVLTSLRKQGLAGRVPGVNSSRDALFDDDMIAVTHIHRAKGNEAPVVFVVDAEFCNMGSGSNLKQKRNVLFTAITRSRAWAYVCGIGDAFDTLEQEFKTIATNHYSLKFHYPPQATVDTISVTSDANAYVATEDDQFSGARSALETIKDTPWEQLPLDIRDMIKSIGYES